MNIQINIHININVPNKKVLILKIHEYLSKTLFDSMKTASVPVCWLLFLCVDSCVHAYCYVIIVDYYGHAFRVCADVIINVYVWDNFTHIYIYIYIHAIMYIYLYVSQKNKCIKNIHTQKYICTRVLIYIQSSIHVTYMHMYSYIYTYIYVCICVYIHVYIYIHI